MSYYTHGKHIGKLLLVLLLLIFYGRCWGQAREWNNKKVDDGTIHSLGNGKMIVYGQGPQIRTIYPGPFSTPSLFQFLVEEPDDLETKSLRENGSAIWTHDFYHKDGKFGSMVDFIDVDMPVFNRQLNLSDKLHFRLKLNEEVTILSINLDENTGSGNMLLMTKPGAKIYQKYVYPKPLYHQIAWKGKVQVKKVDNKNNDFLFEFGIGQSELYFIGGPEYPEVISNSKEVASVSFDQMKNRTYEWWNEFSSSRTDFRKILPETLPMRDKLLRVIDDVAVMIKSQQATGGAVVAGYPYPLGYVRDQYGISRGLLALGLHKEAKNILDFYKNVWGRSGELHCAQGIGVDGIFHIHENDEVESPGYLIIQAFDYYKATGDKKFLKSLFPMLEWCFEVQKRHLAGGMLPFNGDETYVAGGILPRSALNDGSAEATMLFIDGGQMFLDWVRKEKKWDEQRIKRNQDVISDTREKFKKNFWIDNTLITNQPSRLGYATIPEFRHGVCERGGSDCLVFGIEFGGIDWTVKDINGRYQCAICIQLGPLSKIDSKIYNLTSVSLTATYFNSPLISINQLEPVVSEIYNSYKKYGVLSPQYSKTSTSKRNKSVGYDYGLVLYSLIESHNKGAHDIYEQTLEIADNIGAWSEYYVDDKPQGTRCRPWESAMNLEALIKYAMEFYVLSD